MNEKILTTMDTRRETVPAPGPVALNRGPSTNDPKPGRMTPAEFCVRHALPDEWAAFQKTVAARVSKEPKLVWERCGKCGFTFTRPYRRGTDISEPGGPCLKCNWQRYQDGGFMRDLTPAEIKAHFEVKAKADRETYEQDRRAAFNARNDERRRAGLPEFATMAEWEQDGRRRRVKAGGGR